MIREVHPSDVKSICDIYNHYILNSTCTFEEERITAAGLVARIKRIKSYQLPWLVAEQNEQLVGYCYASPWRMRSAYRFSVEVSVYVDHQHIQQGWGRRLYSALFYSLHELGKRTAIAGITLPNADSVKFHENLGMKKVAHFENVGFKFNRWLDVGYWQTSLKEKTN